MKTGLILITILIFVSGCSKPFVTFIKPPCITMTPIIMPAKVLIRTHPDDTILYNTLMDEYQGKIDGHNDKVNKHNQTCDKWTIK